MTTGLADVSLSGLPNLIKLHLGYNRLADVSLFWLAQPDRVVSSEQRHYGPVRCRDLPSLKDLELWGNRVTNVSAFLACPT